jgi:cell division protein ZapA
MAVPGQVDLTVELMGREFRIACPEDEEPALLASVAYLNDRMEQMRESGKIIGNERIALMTALQLAHESRMQALAAQTPAQPATDEKRIRGRLKAMQQQIDLAMQEDPEQQ